MAETRKQEIEAQTQAFHEQHPEVWELFVRFALEMIRRGFDQYSSNAIFERIRWEKDAGGDGTESFKLNNNFRGQYARAFMRAFPQHDGFFRIRKQTSEEAPATDLPPLQPGDYPYV